MKKILLAVLTLIMFSCNQDDSACTTTSLPTGLDINVQQQVTRSLTDATSRLTCLLTNSDGIVTQQSQVSTDSDYGTLHMDAAAGEYSLLIFASKASDYTVGDDATITLGKRNDSFSYHANVTVGSAQREQLSPTLTRCVSRLTVQSTDDVPTTVSKARIQISGVGSTFDISSGKSNSTEYDSGKVAISAANKATDGKFQTFTYQFLPDTESEVTLTLTFYAADDTQVAQVVKEINLKQNVQTTLTGSVFHTPGSDATISLNETWGTAANLTF